MRGIFETVAEVEKEIVPAIVKHLGLWYSKSTMNPQEATINIPLSAVRCVSGKPREKRVMCEIDVAQLRMINEPQTIDELLAAADLDIAAGNYKQFSSVDEMVADLRKV
mgnify:CR=1 FL=1